VKKSERFSERLVQRVNELYHDLTYEQYASVHPEIFEREKERWRRITRQFLNHAQPITVLDVGTGTGFVPNTIARLLGRDDIFICSDISKCMLSAAKKDLVGRKLPCKFRFVKIRSHVPYQLPFETAAVDMVTMNSVLHHVQETDAFLREIDRVLKPNGLLLIGHEPNKHFYRNAFLRSTRAILRTGYYLIRQMENGDLPSVRQEFIRINCTLMDEKLVNKPLSSGDITRIVDIRSEQGFAPESLCRRTHATYELLYVETYNHLFGIIAEQLSNRLTRKCDNLLRRRFPKHGRLFFVVLRKSANAYEP